MLALAGAAPRRLGESREAPGWLPRLRNDAIISSSANPSALHALARCFERCASSSTGQSARPLPPCDTDARLHDRRGAAIL